MSERKLDMTYAVHAAFLRGVEAIPVTVEVSLSGGMPGMCIVGWGDTAVQDARYRIRSALRAAGFELPRKNITVNLAPGDVRKSGTGFDLPIMVAILAMTGQIPTQGLDACLFNGEVTLDGHILPMRGEVAFGLLARDANLRLVGGWSDSHVPLEGCSFGYMDHVADIREGVDLACKSFDKRDAPSKRTAIDVDFADVVGQEVAKRAMAIAATGRHGLLMIGSPGAGKSMLARCMTSILPPIGEHERQEALCVHSVAGVDIAGLLAGKRPFRSPHHTISTAGLVGGGRPVRPGEISLAHGGVLFLDELAEFPSMVLQSFRQPMEQGKVNIVRAEGSYTFPSRFQLLAASNPCPCGFLGDRAVSCSCPPHAVERYQAKLGGPLADRIDLTLDIARPNPEALVEGAEGMSTADLKKLVERGLEFRSWREKRTEEPEKAQKASSFSLRACTSSYALDDTGEKVLLDIAHRNHLTGRGIIRLCKVARTIADIEQSKNISSSHVFEGAMYQGRLPYAS